MIIHPVECNMLFIFASTGFNKFVMLRLRFPEQNPALIVDQFPLKLWATNENGSIIKLEKPLHLSVSLVAAETLHPIVGSCVGTTGGDRQAPTATVLVGCDGTCDVIIRVFAKPKHKYRLCVQPSEAASVAAWVSRVVPKHSALRLHAEAKPRCVPVLSIHSTAFSMGAAPRVAATSMDTEATLCPLLSLSSCEITLSLCEQQMKILPGFGSICWDAAIMLSHFIAANKDFFKGKRCVDLGTGTATVGLTAASAGAHVALTDVPEILPLVEVNVAMNAASIKRAGGSVIVTPLLWGADCSATRLWGADSSAGIDVILASEVAYRAEVFPLLCQTFCNLCGIAYFPDAASEGDFDSCMAALPEAPNMLVTSPIVILGARRRACCEIQEFIAMLQMHFIVYKLRSTAECSGAGELRRKVKGDVTKELSGYMPAICSELSTSARFLSKTEYVPQLFCLVPRPTPPTCAKPR
jgi:hypothetical protein